MKLSLLLPPKFDERKWTLARQVGIKQAITLASSEYSDKPPPYEYASLKSTRDTFNEFGFELFGLEGDQFDMDPIKLGLPNRDECIEHFNQLLENMGRLDIRLLCYNFMASIGWYRTETDLPERGGALVSGYKSVNEEPHVSPEKQVSTEKLWDNLSYFLKAVLPTAEKHGIQLAMHPDDPPLPSIRGVNRIMYNGEAFDRLLRDFPSESNGITFCHGSLKATGEDLKLLSKKWMSQGKVFFLHFRDIKGTGDDFRETFHDNGPTPMAEYVQHYHDCGFRGALRPDHAPTMYGENLNSFHGGISIGYEILGKVFAIGYFKGICDARDIPTGTD